MGYRSPGNTITERAVIELSVGGVRIKRDLR